MVGRGDEQQVGAGRGGATGRRRARGSGSTSQPARESAVARDVPGPAGSDDPDAGHRLDLLVGRQLVERRRAAAPRPSAAGEPVGRGQVGRQVGERGQHEAALPHPRVRHLEVGRRPRCGRRPTARRRRACAGPSAPRAPVRRRVSRARHSSSSSRGDAAVSSSTTRLRYGALVVGPADGIGLVHGRDGDEVGQRRPRPARRWPTRSPRFEPSPRKARGISDPG